MKEIQMYRYLKTLIFLVIFISNILIAEENPVNTAVKRSEIIVVDQSACLRWELDQWPTGMKGVEVLRAELPPNLSATVGEVRLQRLPVADCIPDLTISRARKLKLPGLLDRFLNGSITEQPSEVLLIIFRDQKQFGLLNQVSWEDWDIRQCLGLAFRDSSIQLGHRYRYRVDAVFALNKIQTLWEQDFLAQKVDFDCPVTQLQVLRRGKETVEVRWQIDSQLWNKMKPIGYKVFRSKIGQSLEPLPVPMVSVQPEQAGSAFREYIYWDRDPQVQTDRFRYAVQAVFEGRRTGTWYSTSASSDLPKDDLTIPENVHVESKDGKLIVSWKYTVDQQNKGFSVLRCQDKVSKPVIIGSEILASDVRQVIDDQPPTSPPGSLYHYEVIAISGDYRTDSMPGRSAVRQVPLQKVLPPQSLQGVQEGKTTILTWKPAAGTVIKKYQVENRMGQGGWSAEGSSVTATSMIIKHNEYAPGILLGYRVSAIDDTGACSDPSDIFEFRIPSEGTLPPTSGPSSVKAHQDGERVTIKWEMDDSPKIRGFRVMVDDVVVSDEKTLGRLEREALWKPKELDGKPTVSVHAVLDDGTVLTEKRWNTTVTLKDKKSEYVNIPLTPERPSGELNIQTTEEWFDQQKTKLDSRIQFVVVDSKRILHGICEHSSPSGKPVSRLEYDYGKMHGVQRWFNYNQGGLLVISLYEHGKRVTLDAWEKKNGLLKVNDDERRLLTQSNDNR